eukprot:TRINITY_DN2877_c0_g1_i19.p1 TRINITY_DN2877_c0_g1~~TRINITY_DN2877_c0_g1_i19.p1  ORF type:complete len:179 (+),score=46.04 TRINITY_DN2877_c0_g1_i19:74-538(+)
MENLPILFCGSVVTGFSRGGTELGFPTANINEEDFSKFVEVSNLPSGVYYGFSILEDEEEIQRMVLSLGWNLHYRSEKKTLEVHVLKSYESSFYGKRMSIYIVGHVREMAAFDNLEGLIEAIKNDLKIANKNLDTFSADLQEITWKMKRMLTEH